LKFKKTIIGIIGLLIVVTLFGCANTINVPIEIENDDETAIQSTVINPERQAVDTQIKLYFKHEFSDRLVPSIRMSQKRKQSLERHIVEELFKGPAKFGRVCIMPPNSKVLDVIRKDDTVFINLNEAFKGDIDIASLPDKQNLPEELRPIVLAEMKKLAVYAIVNSLTEVSGVQRVKILIENRSVSYQDLGIESLVSEQPNITPDSMLMPLARNSAFVLSPSHVANEVFSGLVDPLKWEKSYSFLAQTDIDGNPIADFATFMEQYTSYISELTFQILSEEIRYDGTAFVSANFSIAYANGERREKLNYNLRLTNNEGIWNLHFPEFLLRPES